MTSRRLVPAIIGLIVGWFLPRRPPTPQCLPEPMNHQDAPPQEKQKQLHVVCMVTNPASFRSRIRLYHRFAEFMARFPNVTLWTAEGQYRGRDFEVTQSGHPHHLQLHMEHEIWHKENLLNLMVAKLTQDVPDWEYVAWIDADVLFARPDWVEATIAKLQKYPVVQMFTECVDLNSHFEITQGRAGEQMKGMVWSWRKGQQDYRQKVVYGGRPTGHCGYAWACTREAWEIMGGLVDFSIVGSADFQMACALMGDIEDSLKAYEPSEGYRAALRAWGQRVLPLHGKVGYVPGLILHNWHGPKFKRGYDWRVKILVKNQFDPARDLIRDDQGVLMWNKDNPNYAVGLEQALKEYFRYRNEDLKSCENCDEEDC